MCLHPRDSCERKKKVGGCFQHPVACPFLFPPELEELLIHVQINHLDLLYLKPFLVKYVRQALLGEVVEVPAIIDLLNGKIAAGELEVKMRKPVE